MKAVQVQKAVAAVMALRKLKTPTWASLEDDEFLLDPSEIATLVTAYQHEQPVYTSSAMTLH